MLAEEPIEKFQGSIRNQQQIQLMSSFISQVGELERNLDDYQQLRPGLTQDAQNLVELRQAMKLAVSMFDGIPSRELADSLADVTDTLTELSNSIDNGHPITNGLVNQLHHDVNKAKVAMSNIEFGYDVPSLDQKIGALRTAVQDMAVTADIARNRDGMRPDRAEEIRAYAHANEDVKAELDHLAEHATRLGGVEGSKPIMADLANCRALLDQVRDTSRVNAGDTMGLIDDVEENLARVKEKSDALIVEKLDFSRVAIDFDDN